MNNEFKIPEKYLIDFDTLKVGDRVWTIGDGYTMVDGISSKINSIYPILVNGVQYTVSGRLSESDKYPSLFRVNPFEDIREEFFADRLMEVRDGIHSSWFKRVVFGKKNGRWIAWCTDSIKEANDVYIIGTWTEAREITPPSEELVHLTLQDISEGRGKGVPAHLIRIKE